MIADGFLSILNVIIPSVLHPIYQWRSERLLQKLEYKTHVIWQPRVGHLEKNIIQNTARTAAPFDTDTSDPRSQPHGSSASIQSYPISSLDMTE